MRFGFHVGTPELLSKYDLTAEQNINAEDDKSNNSKNEVERQNIGSCNKRRGSEA